MKEDTTHVQPCNIFESECSYRPENINLQNTPKDDFPKSSRQLQKVASFGQKEQVEIKETTDDGVTGQSVVLGYRPQSRNFF